MPRSPGVGRSLTALCGLFLAVGAILIFIGCDRATGSKPIAPSNAQTIADRQPPAAPVAGPAAPSVAPAANTPSIHYASVVDAAKVVITGTSTLHDWTVNGGAIKGHAEFTGDWKPNAASAITLQSIDLSIDVDTLKSAEGGGMDDKIYEALKLKQFPTITYHLTKATLKTAPSKDGSPYHFGATGQLTVAGAAHPVDLDLAILPHDNGKLTIATESGLQMTDLGVTPPTAMFGVIKAGDKINVKVTWQLAIAPAAGSAGQ
jgi:polyisoprenoid-binding protein YceI